MTPIPPPPTATLTVRALLFPSQTDPVEQLGRTLTSQGTLAHLGHGLDRLSSTAARVAHERLAGVATSLSDVRVLDVLVGCWQKYPVLANAARRTLDNPGSEELVDLVDHRLSSVHRPRVEVLVDNVAVGSVEFELELTGVVRSLVADVRAGRLTALHSGRCRLAAGLSCFDLTLAAREIELDLGATLELGTGVALIPGTAQTPGPAPTPGPA